MKARPPLLNSSGYVLEKDGLWLLQKDGWVSLVFGEVAAVKQTSLGSATVHFVDGRKKILTLRHLSSKGFHEVSGALKNAAQNHRKASAAPR